MWRQICGEAKQRYGRLTDKDLDRVEGKVDRLIGVVQKQYGHTREQFSQEIDSFLGEYSDRLQETKGNALAAVEDRVTGYPWPIVVVAFALGLTLGLLVQIGFRGASAERRQEQSEPAI